MGMMAMRAKISRLVSKHGPELATCAKVATSVLIPGGGALAEIIEHMCDHVARHGERDDHVLTQMMTRLGEDQSHVTKLLGEMEHRLDATLTQMTRARQSGGSESNLKEMMELALARDPTLMEMRGELLKLQPQIKLIQDQNEAMLKQQAFAGEMLSQMKDQVNAALSFCQPMMSEGLIGQDAARFMAAHQRFQQSLLAQDFASTKRCLGEMKTLAPHSATVQVCEMAVKAVHQDFTGAEQSLQAAIRSAPQDPTLRAASRSLTSLTRAQKPQSLSALDRLSPSSSSHPRQGQAVGDKGWTLRALLGRGGMGEVWQSVNLRQTEGALKLMLPSLSDDPAFVTRFRGEIDALMKVKHPNIIEILDWGRDHSTRSWYFVTRYIQGQSLTSHLKSGHLSEPQAREVFGALAQGLQVCHQAGIVHRDIKPDNIMMSRDHDPILIDFGIALQSDSGGQTQMATLSYAPPEQLAGGRVGPEADLYALGRTLLEALGGWDALSPKLSQVIDRITHDNPKKRGDAQLLIQDLLGEEAKYYAIFNGAEPEGPIGLNPLAEELSTRAGAHHVWCEGMEGWQSWEAVAEVAQRVAEIKRSRAPKLPPPPPPLTALGALSTPRAAQAQERNAPAGPSVTVAQPKAPEQPRSPKTRAESPWTKGKTQFDVRPPRAGSIAARVARQSGLDERACAVGVRCIADVLIKDLKASHVARIQRVFQIRYLQDQGRISWRPSPSLNMIVGQRKPHLVKKLNPRALHPSALDRWAPSAFKKIGRNYAGKFVKGLSTRRRLAWCVHVESQMPLHWALQLVYAWEFIVTAELSRGYAVRLVGLGVLKRSSDCYISRRVSPKLVEWFKDNG